MKSFQVISTIILNEFDQPLYFSNIETITFYSKKIYKSFKSLKNAKFGYVLTISNIAATVLIFSPSEHSNKIFFIKFGCCIKRMYITCLFSSFFDASIDSMILAIRNLSLVFKLSNKLTIEIKFFKGCGKLYKKIRTSEK